MRAGAAHGHVERRLLCLLGVGRGDLAVLAHAVDDVVAPLDRALAGAERIEQARRLRQRGEIGRFRDRQFVHRFVEIQQRRRGDAVGAESEIDLVQIQFEDLVLGVGTLDLEREQRFLDLARERHFVGQEEVLGDLLGDGRGALRTAARSHVLEIQQTGTRDAAEVEAAVLVEVLVLRRHEGVEDQLRHRLDRQIEPALARIFGEQRAIGRMHARHHRRLVILELRIVRQILGIVPQQARRRGHADDEQDRPGGEQEAQKAEDEFHSVVRPFARVGSREQHDCDGTLAIVRSAIIRAMPQDMPAVLC